jgi:hypothetical protein
VGGKPSGDRRSVVRYDSGVEAQTSTTTKEAGETQVTTEQITGEVLLVDNNILLARMQPSGQYRMFDIQSNQQFMIDGKSKRLVDLTPGTSSPPQRSRRTTTVTNGTVWYVQGNYVILTIDNGQQRSTPFPTRLRSLPRQARHGEGSEAGHEGHGHEDRRGTNPRDLEGDRDNRYGSKVKQGPASSRTLMVLPDRDDARALDDGILGLAAHAHSARGGDRE